MVSPHTHPSIPPPTVSPYNKRNGSLTIKIGKQKVMYALTKIKGVGRRYSNLVCKKADVDLNKRYTIAQEPRTIKIARLT
jgi:hypothetical protein